MVFIQGTRFTRVGGTNRNGAAAPFLLVPLPRVNLVPCINTTSVPQQPYFTPHIQPLKMELIECSETSAYCNSNQTPGKYPKEYIHLDSKHGERLKSRIINPSLIAPCNEVLRQSAASKMKDVLLSNDAVERRTFRMAEGTQKRNALKKIKKSKLFAI